MIFGGDDLRLILLDTQPVYYDQLIFGILLWVFLAPAWVGSMGFGMWLIMTPLYHRWGAGVRFFFAMPFVFIAVGVTWFVFAFIVFPIWAFMWVRKRRRGSAQAPGAIEGGT